jgi:hypothetical protein
LAGPTADSDGRERLVVVEVVGPLLKGERKQ